MTESDGRFVFLQLPPGNYRVTFTLAGFATHVQENIVADRRPGGHPAGGDESVRRLRNGDRHDRQPRVIETSRTAVGDDAESDDDRHDSDPRPQVRRPADADAGRQRRAGPRRRRDQLRRPARHLQQHQPRRRRLQQRLLRRAGRRTARVDRHHARRGQGVPGDRERRPGRIRPHRRRRRQRHHQVRHECRQAAACSTSSAWKG